MRYMLLIIIILFSINVLFAGKYAGDFLEIGAGVRSLSMGGAFSAVADDGSAIYWNPSGIAQIRHTEIGLMRAFLYQGLANYDNLSIVQPLPNDVSIGFHWTRLSITDIPIFSEEHLVGTVDQRISFPWLNLPATPDGYFSSIDDVFQFAFAKYSRYELNMGWLFFELPIDLYFGANMKYINRSLYDYTGTGIGFDLSFMSRFDLGEITEQAWLGDLSLAANLQNIGGTTIVWDTDSEHEDKILFNTKIGVALMQPMEKYQSKFIISTDYDYVYDGTFHVGFEWIYDDLVSGRLGYYDSNFSSGLSLKLYQFILDYAFVTNALGYTNRIGLRMNL